MNGGQQRVQAPRRIGEYEVGGTLGEGTFAKVKYAVHATTGEPVAMKVLDKEKIIRHKMVDQIKREISVMKLVRHPNVVRLYEVLASRTKIYIILEFVTGGELFDKIVNKGRLEEEEARRYFQQLIDAMDYCHSKGVAHRDLKPENLLLDSKDNIKISDFGLSALPQQVRADGLLHTTCGTPNYVAPEVLSDRGYNGVLADIWSCGVILYVLLAGFLPFDEPDVPSLYKKIQRSDFGFPTWFSAGAKRLITGILQPNPKLRYRYQEIKKDPWFRTNYVPVPVFAILPGLFRVEMRHDSGGSQESLQMRQALRAKLQDLVAASHTPDTANDKSSKGKGTGLKQARPRQLAAYPRMGIIPRV
ncbi:unnamed protein product [Closterium sp. Yama58-4]|nr:unnamed protein product [Closterium sp. Yama58-4]